MLGVFQSALMTGLITVGVSTVGDLLLLPFAMVIEGGVPRASLSAGFLLPFAFVSIFATFVAFWLVVEAGATGDAGARGRGVGNLAR